MYNGLMLYPEITNMNHHARLFVGRVVDQLVCLS